jgi:hypothetical protein
MAKIAIFLIVLSMLAGCAEMAQEAQTTRPAETNAPDPANPRDPKKMQQWFTADTPETLPAEKLKKMNLGGPGGFGGY